MRSYIAPMVVLILAGCSAPSLNYEACSVSSAQNYLSKTGPEQGMAGPNRAGLDAFNVRINGSEFGDRRSSQFGFKFKGTALEKVACQSEKLVCEDAAAQHCQSFTCEGVLDAGTEINLIDTPRNEFYRVEVPTHVKWDGESMLCAAFEG